MKKILLFLILFVFIVAGCDKKDNENFVIKGKVIDEDQNPISNVNIFINDLGLTFETDESGNFNIFYPFERKTYTLKFYKEGYITKEEKIDIIGDETNITVSLKYTTLEKTLKKGVLFVGTDLENKPLSFIEGSVKVGFEIDLIKKILSSLFISPVILNVKKNDSIESLLNSDIDLVISSISKEFIENHKDKNKIIYSRPYFVDGYVIIVRENEKRIKDFSSLKGKRVLVSDKSIISILEKNVNGIKTIDYEPSIENCVKDMQFVLYDAIVTKFSLASYFVKRYKKIKIVNDVLNKEEYVIVLRSEDYELMDKINLKIDELIKTKDFYKIYNSWFNPLDKFNVN